MPRVSIVVPVFGAERFIERCARSLFEQTFKSIEYIFVNDCTKDQSMIVLDRVIHDYRNLDVKIINKKKNEGTPAARETGVENSTGDYILHVDSDDWIDLTMVEKLYKKAVEEEADMVYCDIVVVSHSQIEYIKHKLCSIDDYYRNMLRFIAYPAIWNRLVKRNLYEGLEFPSMNVIEDYVTLVQLIPKCKKISLVPEPLYHQEKDHPESITSKSESRDFNAQKVQAIYGVYNRLIHSNESFDYRHEMNILVEMALWKCLRYNAFKLVDKKVVDALRKRLHAIPVSKHSNFSIGVQLLMRIVYISPLYRILYFAT